MATIKAGTYRFNDVLTAPPDNMWRESINFTVNSIVAGAEIVSSCEAISFGRNDGVFNINYDVVNDDGSHTPTELYSNAVTEYHSKGWYTSYLGFKSKETLMTYAGLTDEQASSFATSYGDGIKTIDFGTEPQTVSAEFYDWLTANATQPMASVSHNGEAIASLFAGQTATLKCAGMKMAGDVVVSVAEQKAVEVVEDYDGTITIV